MDVMEKEILMELLRNWSFTHIVICGASVLVVAHGSSTEQ